jgi:hypothetical protein
MYSVEEPKMIRTNECVVYRERREEKTMVGEKEKQRNLRRNAEDRAS